LFGGLLLVLAIVVVRLIRKRLSTAYINTAIVRLAFVVLFSYLLGKTGNQAYLVVLIMLGFGEAWTLIALALDLREWIVASQNPMSDGPLE
jgi:tellurite resistance protein TehA-like permease